VTDAGGSGLSQLGNPALIGIFLGIILPLSKFEILNIYKYYIHYLINK